MRKAVFVDAGYLIAEAGKLCLGTRSRGDIKCDYPGVVSFLIDFVATHSPDDPLLRVYWYDGATKGIPTLEHDTIGSLANVKVRLGRVSGGRQKGVDSRIIRDLITLGRNRAVTTVFLLAGDEDLREGVVDAQETGVRVVLLGVPTRDGKKNQSPSLIREADEYLMLGQDGLRGFFSSMSAQAPPQAEESATPEAVGTDFAQRWVDRASGPEVMEILARRPQIPLDVDAQLMDAAKAGDIDTYEQSNARAIRAAFWRVIVSAPVDEEG